MIDKLSKLLKNHDHDDPEEVDKLARRLVKLAKLDDEGCYQTPNDFEECVELVKRKVLLPEPTYGRPTLWDRVKARIPGVKPFESEFDEELDDLIFRRGMLQFEIKYGLKWEIDDDLL